MPSPCPSNRVPFGNGGAIHESLDGPASVFPAYDPAVFLDPQAFFSRVSALAAARVGLTPYGVQLDSSDRASLVSGIGNVMCVYLRSRVRDNKPAGLAP